MGDLCKPLSEITVSQQTTKEPFEEYEDWEEFYDAIVNKGERPNIDEQCPSVLRELMQSCWSGDRSDRPTFPEIIVELDRAILQCECRDAKAQAFWSKHFLEPKSELEERVSWRDFERKLRRHAKIKDKNHFKILEAVLCKEDDVTLQKFVLSVNWFGYYFEEEHTEKCMAEVSDCKRREAHHAGPQDCERRIFPRRD